MLRRHADENEEDDIEEEDDSPFIGDDLSGDEQPVDDRHGERGWTLGRHWIVNYKKLH